MGILGWNFKKLISYLKSTFSNLLTCKVSSKNKKNLNLGPKFLFQNQTFKGTFNRYVTLKGGKEGNPFCYGALSEGEGGSSDTVT